MTHNLDVGDTLRRAVALHRAGRLDEAGRLYRAVLIADAKHADALTLLGTVCMQRGEWEEGFRFIDRSLALNPRQPHALVNRGNALARLKRFDEALLAFDRAIALSPDLGEAFNNRGNALRHLGRPDEALQSYDRAIALRPDYAEAHNHRGSVLRELRRPDEALASCERALAIRPDYAEAFNDRAVALRDLGRPDEALRSCDRAIALKPELGDAYFNRGKVLHDLGQLTEALRSHERAFLLNPELAYAEGLILHLRMLTCDWTDLKARTERVLEGVERGARVALPFELLATSATPAQQQRCAITFSRAEFPPVDVGAFGASGGSPIGFAWATSRRISMITPSRISRRSSSSSMTGDSSRYSVFPATRRRMTACADACATGLIVSWTSLPCPTVLLPRWPGTSRSTLPSISAGTRDGPALESMPMARHPFACTFSGIPARSARRSSII